jgi:uncharacterized membrane protein
MTITFNGHTFIITSEYFHIWLALVLVELIVTGMTIRYWYRKKHPKYLPDEPWPATGKATSYPHESTQPQPLHTDLTNDRIGETVGS